MEFTHDGKSSLFGTWDETTAWRMDSIGQGMAVFGFEDIGGDTVPIPAHVSMRCLEATPDEPFKQTEAPKIGEHYLLREGVSYDLVMMSRLGNSMRSLLNITKKQHHEVRSRDPTSKVKVVGLRTGHQANLG